MSAPHDPLVELDKELSRLSTTADKATAAVTLVRRLGSQHPRLIGAHLPAGGNSWAPETKPLFPMDEFNALMERHEVSQEMLSAATLRTLGQLRYVLDRVPCANVDPQKNRECLRDGTLVCSSCRLVLYCSKECQKAHWRIHASDCKDRIRSDKWTPAWVSERRLPSFMTGRDLRGEPLSQGMCLCGNMPAIDILNLLRPEDAASRETINIAFVASGDLRDVILTINSLSRSYAGKVTCLINDANKYVTLRNLLILQILGSVPDHARAADIALHLWYSAFIPQDYQGQLLAACVSLVSEYAIPQRLQLGSHSSVDAFISPEICLLCAKLCSPEYGLSDATNELARVRFHPSRADVHDRHYVRLDPSHRLSMLEYRRFCLALPFGAHNAHFGVPNPLMFSETGEWLQADHSMPIEGWNILDVIKSGKTHGTTPQDLFGCFYFHVLDQLREFAARLSCFSISFKLFCQETTKLARDISYDKYSLHGLATTTRFDRIDVSNLMDLSYLGVARTIEAWGNHLKRTDDATLLGYFMNWHAAQTGARPQTVSELNESVEKLRKTGRIPFFTNGEKLPKTQAIEKAMGSIASYPALCSVYDNSGAFEQYLNKQGLEATLRRSGLKRKLKHTVVPHRLCAPLDGAPSALPVFNDKESWYFQSEVAAPMWSERYIELTWA